VNGNVEKTLRDWCNLVNEDQKNKKDVWSGIPQLPGYKFLNLKIEHSPLEITETDNCESTITFKYDDFKKDE